MSFAKVTIVGNLGRDPETKYSQNGTLIISFTMAAQGRFRSGQEPTTTWFRVSAFGQQAERLATMVERGYIAKGRLLYVEGQLEENTFTGNDGQERKSLEVTLSDWQFVGGRDNQQEGQRGQGNNSGGNQGGGFGGNQRGGYGSNQGGGRSDQSQDSGGYGGSDYGNEFPSGDEPSDLNDVPF